MKREKREDSRGINYCCIFYPESVYPDWKNRIGECLVDCFVSPLHAPTNSDREEDQRKPHYHALFMFPSKKSEDQVKEILNYCFGSYAFNYDRCKVPSARNYARYLLHLDQPDKEQFKDGYKAVLEYGTKSYKDVIESSKYRYLIIKRLIDIVNEYGFIEYGDLVDFCVSNDEEGFMALADNCSYFLDCYIKSKRRKYVDSKKID